MKKAMAFIIAAVFAVGCSSCLKKSDSNQAEPAQTTSSTVYVSEPVRQDITTTESPVTLQTEISTESRQEQMSPTETDLEILMGLVYTYFDGKSYNSEKDVAMEYLVDLGYNASGVMCLPYNKYQEGKNAFHLDSMEDHNPFEDPRGWFTCCIKVEAEPLEWYLKNVFHNSNFIEAARTGSKEGGYYREDNWYYLTHQHFGGSLMPYLNCDINQRNKNNHFYITVTAYTSETARAKKDQNAVGSIINVDATLTEQNGLRLWTIYSAESVYYDPIAFSW